MGHFEVDRRGLVHHLAKGDIRLNDDHFVGSGWSRCGATFTPQNVLSLFSSAP